MAPPRRLSDYITPPPLAGLPSSLPTSSFSSDSRPPPPFLFLIADRGPTFPWSSSRDWLATDAPRHGPRSTISPFFIHARPIGRCVPSLSIAPCLTNGRGFDVVGDPRLVSQLCSYSPLYSVYNAASPPASCFCLPYISSKAG